MVVPFFRMCAEKYMYVVIMPVSIAEGIVPLSAFLGVAVVYVGLGASSFLTSPLQLRPEHRCCSCVPNIFDQCTVHDLFLTYIA